MKYGWGLIGFYGLMLTSGSAFGADAPGGRRDLGAVRAFEDVIELDASACSAALKPQSVGPNVVSYTCVSKKQPLAEGEWAYSLGSLEHRVERLECAVKAMATREGAVIQISSTSRFLTRLFRDDAVSCLNSALSAWQSARTPLVRKVFAAAREK